MKREERFALFSFFENLIEMSRYILTSVDCLTKMEKEREKMRAVLPFFYKTNTQKFSVRVHGYIS